MSLRREDSLFFGGYNGKERKEKEGERHQHQTGGIQHAVCAEYRVGVRPPLRDYVLFLYGLVGHYGFPKRDLCSAAGGQYRSDRAGHRFRHSVRGDTGYRQYRR